MGFVHVRGMVKNGTVSPYSTGAVFTLPPGYRPMVDCLFATVSCEAGGTPSFSVAYVRADGKVEAGYGFNAWFCFNGISFKAEQ